MIMKFLHIYIERCSIPPKFIDLINLFFVILSNIYTTFKNNVYLYLKLTGLTDLTTQRKRLNGYFRDKIKIR